MVVQVILDAPSSIYPSFSFYIILSSHTAISFLKTHLFLACVSCHTRLLTEHFILFTMSRFKWDKIWTWVFPGSAGLLRRGLCDGENLTAPPFLSPILCAPPFFMTMLENKYSREQLGLPECARLPSSHSRQAGRQEGRKGEVHVEPQSSTFVKEIEPGIVCHDPEPALGSVQVVLESERIMKTGDTCPASPSVGQWSSLFPTGALYFGIAFSQMDSCRREGHEGCLLGGRLEGVLLSCHRVWSAGELLSESLCTFLKENLVSKDNHCQSYSVFRCVCAGWGKMVEKEGQLWFLNKTSDWDCDCEVWQYTDTRLVLY